MSRPERHSSDFLVIRDFNRSLDSIGLPPLGQPSGGQVGKDAAMEKPSGCLPNRLLQAGE